MDSNEPVTSPLGIKPISMKVSRLKNVTHRKLNDETIAPTQVDDSFDLLNANGSDRVFRTDAKFANGDNSFDLFEQQTKTPINLEAQRKTASKMRRVQARMNKSRAEFNTNDPMKTRYTKPWDMADLERKYKGKVRDSDLPMPLFDGEDYEKKLKFEHLKQIRLEAMCKWKQKDTKGSKKNGYIKQITRKNKSILKVAEKTDLEKLEVYTDRFPMLNLRKSIHKGLLLVKLACFQIISTSLFDNISIAVIIANSAVMAIDDSQTNENASPIWAVFEKWFQILYSIEMVFKIVGLGFIIGPDTYLRDPWNILDFTIVVIGWATFDFGSQGGALNKADKEAQLIQQNIEKWQPGEQESSGVISIAALRTFRVLRPLKTVSSIKGLKVLIVAVLSAIPMLKDTILIMLFFFVIFSIACTQLFSGILKNRCYNIQTGIIHPDEQFCNADKQTNCPGGYYCSKGFQNPNEGVTSFDNIQYSLLTIFQFVTLEGWSEIQRDIQITFSRQVWPLFMIIVILGAFFLLNLTLAVINSKFTESQTKQQEQDKIEMQRNAQPIRASNDDPDAAIQEEMSISQYITARIYAKKMIQFLRMRQTIKRIEQQRQDKMKEKQKKDLASRRQIRGSSPKFGLKSFKSIRKTTDQPSPSTLRESTEKDKPVNVLIMAANKAQQDSSKSQQTLDIDQSKPDMNPETIQEDVQGEHGGDEGSDQDEEKLNKDIKDFLKKSKIDMQRKGIQVKDMKIPRMIDTSVKKSPVNIGVSNHIDQQIDGGPTMKGNIEPVKRGFWNHAATPGLNKKFAEEFDIDNVIPKDDQLENNDEVEHDSMASFQLSLNGLHDSNLMEFTQNSRGQQIVRFNNQPRMQTDDLIMIPGYEHEDRDNHIESGLITSDSDFDQAVQCIPGMSIDAEYLPPKSSLDVKKDVTKAFKKMLTLSNQRTSQDNGKTDVVDSTRYGGSALDHENSNQDISFNDIESKFIKKSHRVTSKLQKKYYQEDAVGDNFLQNQFTVDRGDQPRENLRTNTIDKRELRTLDEFVSTKKPIDPFKDLNPLTHKVEIAKNVIYQGTSQQEIFMPRKVKQDLNMMANSNIYVKRKDEQYDEFEEKQFIKNIWDPYQQKKEFEVEIESSQEDESLNEDEIQAEQQPFFTPTRIGYYQQTKQSNTQEVAKRSDIMITSTLSLSLFPKDQRNIKSNFRIQMNQDDVDEYLDEKGAFRSMVKEHIYQNSKVREKDQDYRENYVKSFLHRADFQSETLRQFKRNVMILNRTKKPEVKKSREQIMHEKQKHNQNKRASEKRGMPTFDLEQANKLLTGKFHEEVEEDHIDVVNINNLTINAKTHSELIHQEHISKFEMQLQNILQQDEETHFKADEIPLAVRQEFSIPRNLGPNIIDFEQIRLHDARMKKTHPMWSGQDVLQDHLDNQKSLWIIQHINKIRVWPDGLFGIYKRLKFVTRQIVKNELYDNFFTFFVFLNTITLSLNSHGMSEPLKDFLKITNNWFTGIFIVEMVVKIAGIGIQKYLADKLNYMDGFIVLASVFELIYTAIQEEGEGGLQALQLLRLLRTLRVVRIIRLLRSLESIQTIVSVMAKSYMSFVYITGLVFLFILIFTLLGMSMFGGYWKNDEEGLPDNNFDKFGQGLFTVFQVFTMENWQSVLYVMNRQNTRKIDPWRSASYLFLWICIGNFILLNLFLAILLDAFLVDDEELDEEEIYNIKQKKLQRKLDKKRKIEAQQVIMDTTQIKQLNKQDEPSKFYFGMAKTQEEEDLEDLDEDQVEKIFKDEGMIKKDKKELDEQKLFIGIECQQSFYAFSQQNPIRITCYRLIKHPKWDTVVLLLIGASSAKLVFDTFYIETPDDAPVKQAAVIIDKCFNYLFIAEMLTKLLALGLIMDEGSYLRDTWNQMDFFIVISSIFDMALAGQNLGALKILRMLRTLRPLRFLTHNVGLKLIVNALIGSIGGISNVLIVVAIVFLIFAILFVNFYMGQFFYCSIDPYLLHTQIDCEFAGGSWEVYDHNFDNVPNGWITLYIVASLEGWPDIMLQAVAANEIDKGPLPGQSNAQAIILFMLFIFVGCFFFLNFFIGVLFMRFNKAQEEEQKGYTEKDLAWMDIQRLILEAEPDYESTNIPASEFRKKFHRLVSSPRFDGMIMFIIILNMIQMGLLQEQMSEGLIKGLEISNIIFSIIFIIEAILKLIAYGRTYFDANWNRFDFFVVSASIFDFIMDAIPDIEGGTALLVLPKIGRILRVLRVTRILRLAGKAKSLQSILQTIQFSIPALANVFVLLMLIYFMFAVLINFEFWNITEGEVIDPDYKNFRNFINSFVLLFALSTGEDWNKVMYDCAREKEDGCVEGINCGNKFFSFAVFLLMILVCSYVMLNLFILVIIQQFEKYYLPEVNMLALFKNDLVSFMKIWKELTQNRYKCLKIKENQISAFFRKLGLESDSLGFPLDQYDEGELKKHILKMAIKADNGYIFFNEMLYRCMRRKYGNMKINKKMQIFELRTQYQIYIITKNVQNQKSYGMSNDDIFNSLIRKENGVNPFLRIMNFKISFKTWLKMARQALKQGADYKQKNLQGRRTVGVEIEVEEMIEITSDEDDLGTSIYGHSRNFPYSASQSKEGSLLNKPKKKKDTFDKFRKSMGSKVKIHQLNRSVQKLDKSQLLVQKQLALLSKSEQQPKKNKSNKKSSGEESSNQKSRSNNQKKLTNNTVKINTK